MFEFKWSSLSEADVERIINKMIERINKTGLKGYNHHLYIITKEKPIQPVADVEVLDISDMSWKRS
ncbi:MAG: hypothetical protein QXZ41_06505 [Ignisphaera sp.]|uniref:Uncharacterized protein n=1 Tax=Ignisphaera aggregans TaxID=334771 RepID=A0A7C4NP18_9CREN